MKVAFQGEKGAFSERAAKDFFKDNKAVSAVPCREFKEIFHSVETGKAKYGVIPVENSNAGSIYQNYDLLLASKTTIVGEIKLRIHHHLMVKPGKSLKTVAKVYSHPQALMQCSVFLEDKQVEQVAFYDTAGAAKWVSQTAEDGCAAIGDELAAQAYGLKIVKRRIENNRENYTRFVIIAKSSVKPRKSSKAKTSIVFALQNIPGGLHKALSVFAIRDIDLTSLHSRPIPGSPWKYYFYVDFLGSVTDPKCANAVGHLSEITKICRVLGSYPQHR